jgi:glyceraldehyde 3-phosphate dehydrogenase
VEEAFFTSVHAYTTEQSLIDAPQGPSLRLSRAAVENIVPVDSWTEAVMPKLFPKLAGRFGGCKLNVPVPDASCVDLVTTLRAQVGARDVNDVFRSASGSTMKGIVDYTDEPIVSSDVSGSAASCTFDSLATMTVQDSMLKTLGWYAQGGGLAHRLVEVLRQLAPKSIREAS